MHHPEIRMVHDLETISAFYGTAGNSFYIVPLQAHEQDRYWYRYEDTAGAESGEISLVVSGIDPVVQSHCYVISVGVTECNVGCEYVITPGSHEGNQRGVDDYRLCKRDDHAEEYSRT